MKQENRMMWKMAGILFGLILLFFLICRSTKQGEGVPEQEKAVTELENVWIKSIQKDAVTYFYEGKEYTALREESLRDENHSKDKRSPKDKRLPRDKRPQKEEEDAWEGEQVADIVLINGSVASIHSKREKISGKLLRRADNWLEIEGHGKFEVTDGFQGYRLYEALETVLVGQMPINSSYIDYVMEDGKICAALLTREEQMESIRVLIQAGNYEGIYHERIVLCGEGAYRVEGEDGSEIEEFHMGEKIEFTAESEVFQRKKRIRIVPETLTDRMRVESIVRSQGAPAYRGSLEIVKEKEGLYLINEVLLEEYLYAVVPSEMPADYPMEALKAQSICARTYAYRNLLQAGFPELGVHVDDSTAYQVYQNIAEQERTTQAVRETSGQVLYVEDVPAGTYYYSTSCGYGTDAGIWKGTEELSYLRARHIAEGEACGDRANGKADEKADEKADGGGERVEGAAGPDGITAEDMSEEEIFAERIIRTDEHDYEKAEPWYRWSYEVEKLDVKIMERRLRERQQAAQGQILIQKTESGSNSNRQEKETEGERKAEGFENRGEFIIGEIKELGEIRDIRAGKRRSGGVIDELIIEGSRQTVKVISEYNVRYVLCDGAAKVRRQDGSETEAAVLIPSAFFVIEPISGNEGAIDVVPEEKIEKETKTEDGKVTGSVVGYRLIGGGYGHGVGMSQNGAARMADGGRKAEEILTFFYEGGRLLNLYETGGDGQ